MRSRSISEHGQALVIIALAIVGLVGITGLAIDGSNLLADRRHAQNVADTSALAGALARVKPQTDGSGTVIPWKLVAQDRAESNGYTNNLVTSSVEVYSCDETSIGADCPAPYSVDKPSDYVQVIITSHVDTFFARVLGIPTLTNRVQAVALSHPDGSGLLLGGAGVYATNPDCPADGSLFLTGGADVTITGGALMSNSDDSCAVKCNYSGVYSVPGGIITPGGGFMGSGCDGVDTSADGTQLDYHADIPDIPEPPECDNTDSANWPTNTIKNFDNPVTGTTVLASYLTPGYYNDFPPNGKINNITVKKTMVLAPGVYCVDTVYKQTADGISVFGDDVTIYVRPGHDLQLTGGVVQLRSTNGSGAPYAPHGTSNKVYKGFLFIVAPDYDGPLTACTITGNVNNILEGAIFAPHCNVKINGGSGTPPEGIKSQIIGYNVTINGNANLTIDYNSDLNPYIIDPPRTGITR